MYNLHLKILSTSEVTKEIYTNYPHSTEENIGFDLIFPEQFTMELGTTKLIFFDIKVAAYRGDKRVGYFITPRSSIFKTPLRQANSIGVIDSGYNGNLAVLIDFYCVKLSAYPMPLFYAYEDTQLNLFAPPANETYYYTQEANTRLFQIVDPCGVGITWEIVDEIEDTKRGENGFGSSGV